MIIRPKFWKTKNIISFSLIPLSVIYFLVTKLFSITKKPKEIKIPVICIGNITAGGSGKTPVSIEISDILKKSGYTPCFLTRGYGREASKDINIALNDQNHSYKDCGDESLLLCKSGQVFINKNRYTGAKKAVKSGSDIIIMDDGLQNYTLKKDISFLVISGFDGIGNGLLIPSGPLRETLNSGLKKADAIIITGEDRLNTEKHIPSDKKIFRTDLKFFLPKEAENVPLIAFAGISNNEKFFESLKALNCNIVKTVAFPDHYPYKNKDIKKLLEESKNTDSKLITTEKDYVRIPEEYRSNILTLPIKQEIKEKEEFISFLITQLQNFKSHQ